MIQFNQDLFDVAVKNLQSKHAHLAAYLKAIDRAVEMIDDNPYVTFTDKDLLIMSDTSSEIYLVNSDCKCAARMNGQICKHLVAYDLVYEYNSLVKFQDNHQPVFHCIETLGGNG